MAVRVFRLRNGWRLVAKTEPHAWSMNFKRPARELVLWEPPEQGGYCLGSGLSVSGVDYRECFQRLRADLGKGFLRARFV